MKMNEKHLFGGVPQRHLQMKELFEGRRELLPAEDCQELFECCLDDLHDGSCQIVARRGRVNSKECRDFILEFEERLGAVPCIPSEICT